MHVRKELFEDEIRKIDLSAGCVAGDLIRRLRGLTTSEVDEAAYFIENGKKYRIQVRVVEE
jgi:hypothetical protein